MPKVGRNDLCPCGSDKKYKKCCASQAATSNDQRGFETDISRFKELHPDVDITVVMAEGSNGLKMSEVIMEFAEEFASLTKKNAEYRSLLMLAVIAWNLGIISISEDELDEMIKCRLHDLFNEDSVEWHTASALIKSLALKKQKEYSDVNRYIINCEFVESSSGNEFKVLSLLKPMAA